MISMENYLNEYSESHQNKINKLIHKLCVPAILFSVFGLLDSFPIHFNLSFVLIGFALTFYLLTKTTLKLFLFVLIEVAVFEWINLSLKMPFKFYVSASIFSVAWVLQFIGHFLEGKKPSFFKDLLFLFIGPVWVWANLLNE